MRRLALSLASALSLLSALAHGQLILQPYGKIKDKDLDEPSGLVKSRQYPNVYWTHNDSGDSARIFAIKRNGKNQKSNQAKIADASYEGIPIQNAKNIDWEDIATDNSGNLIVADSGNNDNNRRNLSLYIIPEPNPQTTEIADASRRIDFHYPDQTRFPDPKQKDFDCESIFHANGKIYLVSKNRSTPETKLYRLDQTAPGASQPLSLVGSFPLNGQATAADATPDGTRLAILTYSSVWVFEKTAESDNYFEGNAFFRPLIAKQCEAICWDDEQTLLIANEQSDLYEIKLAEIPPFRP